jgi:hypothetical protein
MDELSPASGRGGTEVIRDLSSAFRSAHVTGNIEDDEGGGAWEM